MLKVENIDIYGWEAAIRGMRNPMNSWEKSDSRFYDCDTLVGDYRDILGNNSFIVDDDYFKGPADGVSWELGPNDKELMKKLIKAGPEHRKFLRMVHVSMDITAPLYWWKEFDTYKVGTVANSCSTMHKIAAKEFTLDDFSHEELLGPTPNDVSFTAVSIDGGICLYTPIGLLSMTCEVLNRFRKLYLETKNKDYWWQMIQLLPSSYNQKRTVDFNYETAMTIIRQRTGHKLYEWSMLIDILEALPYMEELKDG